MIATLTRGYAQNATLGILELHGIDHLPIFTLEPPWKDNKRNISSIPPGSYQVEPHVSPRFGLCFYVREVEGRSHILIHAGNYAKDTQGCILVGLGAGQMNGRAAVKSSKSALKYLRSILKDTFILNIK